ncbi:MAG: hypothetical protein GY950_04155 [bacterium]|nr:hypothetical protein [bacterium]
MKRHLEKAETWLRVALVVVIALFVLGQVKNIFNVPIDKPYYTGKWDEPFAVNAGINALRNNGNPQFFSYGGTSVYPHALFFYLYCKDKGITPQYKVMNKKFHTPHWPITRKIHPVKPIFISKIAAYIFYLSGTLLYVVLFSLLLLPVPFLLIPSIQSSSIFSGFAFQLLPEMHVGILSGLTTIFFIKALFEEKISRYYSYLVLTTVCASLTVAAKISSAYILLLPLALAWRLVKEKYFTRKRVGILAAAAILPYIIFNPAVIFNPGAYKKWLGTMTKLSELNPEEWPERLDTIGSFIKNLHLLDAWPALPVIGLFIAACILMIKKNPAAFLGFMLFLLLSFYTIVNMKHSLYELYTRHFSILILPVNVLILFPLIYYFKKVPKAVRAGITLVCLVVTIWAYPPWNSVQHIVRLKDKSFSSQWKKESRDRLIDFVKTNDAVLYFYDYHGFSLPDNLYPRIIPFSETDRLPRRLGQNQYVAFIKYKDAGKGQLNPEGKYNRDIARLLRDYRPVKIFGKPGGAHDINDAGPRRNPTIVLLKEKKEK